MGSPQTASEQHLAEGTEDKLDNRKQSWVNKEIVPEGGKIILWFEVIK